MFQVISKQGGVPEVNVALCTFNQHNCFLFCCILLMTVCGGMLLVVEYLFSIEPLLNILVYVFIAKVYTFCSCVSVLAEGVVSDDMLVTHFLIQPDPMGVKLQGWNEKPFSECKDNSSTCPF